MKRQGHHVYLLGIEFGVFDLYLYLQIQLFEEHKKICDLELFLFFKVI